MEKEPSEIAKLTERISKDPKSKLFVPLAEEYKKIGDIEMAIHVLSEGLKNNPGYVTARSFLGRLLLEAGDMDAARRELEEVVKAVPENLLAQRKLADVYALQGNRAEALTHYKIALSLTPGDAEVATLVSELEAGLDVRPTLVQQTVKPSPEPAVKSAGSTDSRQQSPVQAAAPHAPSGQSEPVKTTPPAEEASLPVEEPRQTEKEAPETLAEVQSPGEPGRRVEAPVLGEPVVQQPESSALLGAASPSELGEGADAAEEIGEVEPLEEERSDLLSAGAELPSETESEGLFSSTSDEQRDLPEAATTPVQTTEAEPLLKESEELFSFTTDELDEGAGIAGGPEAESSIAEPSAEEPADMSDEFTTDTLAELYIAQGFYEKAIDIYERMAADHPTSKGLREKLDRVRAMAMAEGTAAGAEESSADTQQKKRAGGVPETAVPGIAIPDSREEAAEDIVEISEDHILSAETTDNQEEPAAWAPVSEKPSPPSTGQRASSGRGSGGDEEELTIEAELLDEHGEGSPEAEPALLPAEDAIFGEAVEYKPGKDAEAEHGAEGEAFDIFAQPPNEVRAAGRPPYTDFEPREYIPPTAVPKPAQEHQKGTVAAQQPAAARKETIDRLENWLKNIMKEK